MAALRAAKKQLRSSIREITSSIPVDSINEQSQRATAALQSMIEYKDARSISIYLSMPKGEILTDEIVKQTLLEGKDVYAPVIYERTALEGDLPPKLMDMVSLHSVEDYGKCQSNLDTWGIPTIDLKGSGQRRSVLGYGNDAIKGADSQRHGTNGGAGRSLNKLDMVVMPGMAFDKRLSRLGHGKGFYDLFLSRYRDAAQSSADRKTKKMPFLVGVTLREQLLPDDRTVPTSDSDWPLDALVTGDGAVIRFDQNS